MPTTRRIALSGWHLHVAGQIACSGAGVAAVRRVPL
jgi:hypothetical protein